MNTCQSYSDLVNGVARYFGGDPKECTCTYTIRHGGRYQRYLQENLTAAEYFRVGVLLTRWRRNGGKPPSDEAKTLAEILEEFDTFERYICMDGWIILAVLEELYGPKITLTSANA